MGDAYPLKRRAFRVVATLWIALALAACSGDAVDPGAGGPALGEPAPVYYAAANAVSGQYIVVFKDDAHVPPGLARRLVDQHGGELEHEYTAALHGFAARLPAQALDGIRRNPHVALIEQDLVLQAEAFVQPHPTWNLDRIDQREFPLDKAYTYTHTGAGVTAYIIDTGIRFDHQEFDGRAAHGFDVFNDGMDGDDCRGHGTHVAGIVGGTVWGIAKEVSLVSVRVLDCHGTGTVSGAIAGIDWVAKNRQLPAVANMSFGAALSESLNRATRNLIQSGVQVAIAAGNSDSDACNISPASTREAVTVGNAGTSTRNDRQPSSNWGDCVDLFAPGVGILAASHGDSTSGVYRGGTSMSAPHAAGVMALWLHENPALTPTELHGMVVSNATQNVVGDAKSANAHMLFGLWDAASLPGTPPTASFSASCSGLTCSFDASASTGGSANLASYDWTFGDGATGSGVTPSRTYAAGGSYTVTLTVTNTDGATRQVAKTVSVSAANQAPVARFTTSCELLVCTFTDGSADADGTVVAWSWSFGDGTTSTTRSPVHTFAAAGTNTVALTVTDDAGATSSTSQSVTVAASAPTADFTYTCEDANCQFHDTSVSASSVRQWSWRFGDGGTSSVQNPSYSYQASGTYSVWLQVTDEHGQQSSTTRTVTVTVPASGITLSAGAYRVRGARHVDLVWTGASGSHVTVHRDGALVETVLNGGRHTDAIGGRGPGDYRYRVCEVGTGVCSPEVLVEFR